MFYAVCVQITDMHKSEVDPAPPPLSVENSQSIRGQWSLLLCEYYFR